STCGNASAETQCRMVMAQLLMVRLAAAWLAKAMPNRFAVVQTDSVSTPTLRALHQTPPPLPTPLLRQRATPTLPARHQRTQPLPLRSQRIPLPPPLILSQRALVGMLLAAMSTELAL